MGSPLPHKAVGGSRQKVGLKSLAIATEAAHLLTDLTSFTISLITIWLARRSSTERMSFGWHRAEVLRAILSVLRSWVIIGLLVYMSMLRVISMEFEIDTMVMMITSGSRRPLTMLLVTSSSL